MSPAKTLLKFILIFAVVYGILILPNLGKVYAGFIRSQGEFFFGSFRKNGVVRFEPNQEVKNKWEFRNKMFLFNQLHFVHSQRTGASYTKIKVYSSWYQNYLFIALFLSLTIATPIVWKRKLIALAAGFLLLHVYVLFTFYIHLLYKFNSYPDLEVVHLSSFGQKVVNLLYPILVLSPGSGLFMAVLIWMVVCFKKGDFEKLTHTLNYSKPKPFVI